MAKKCPLFRRAEDVSYKPVDPTTVLGGEKAGNILCEWSSGSTLSLIDGFQIIGADAKNTQSSHFIYDEVDAIHHPHNSDTFGLIKFSRLRPALF